MMNISKTVNGVCSGQSYC